ncbi:hypothetical protein GCM10023318_35360 [Nocardia callitridis]|uniref:HTH luxR-type domain-containing protein n=1 Tax=Nocardia callitridis TaxID=648753 RepID=A0ABP9KHS3_9NOCA
MAAPTSEMVGRQTELDRLGELLRIGARMISVIGPGGIGKTRLAAEALRRARDTQHRPVYWARLAEWEVGRPATAHAAVLAPETTDVICPPTPDAVLNIFTSGEYPTERAVLVLDSCEHMLEAVGVMITELLAVAPDLTILATSREPIGWVDEYILMVPPLSPRRSLELLRQRAELVGVLIPDDPAQVAAAARICRRVDHNPLFIRLAAARLRHQPPVVVLRELTGDADDKRLRWTHGARVGAEPRHRGVYDVVAWSFALCSASEQLLLERLSVFATGYESDEEAPRTGIDLEAVIAVCGDERLPADDIEHLLERLTERSLLSVHLAPTTGSWYILESVHVFARQRLRRRDPDEADRLAAAHRRHFRDRVVGGQPLLRRRHDPSWMAWVRSAWNDIVLGIETGLADPGEARIGLETSTVLLAMWVPFVKGGSRALTRLTERALAATERDQDNRSLTDVAARLLCWSALWQGRVERADELLEDTVRTQLGRTVAEGWRASADGDLGLPAGVDWMCALGLLLIAQDPRAIAVAARARDKYAARGDETGAKHSGVMVAFCAALLGSREQALAYTQRHLITVGALGSAVPTAWAEIVRAIALAKHDGADAADVLATGVLSRYSGTNDVWTTSWAVGARILVAKSRLHDALTSEEASRAAAEIAFLIGGFQERSRAVGVVLDRVPLLASEIRDAADKARAVLGDRGYATAEQRTRQRGDRSTPWWCRSDPTGTQRAARTARVAETVAAEVVAAGPIHDGTAEVIHDGTVEPVGARYTDARWNQLSRAERDVAVFAAAGWPNSAIALERRSSIRTVDAQVASIRQKLMITSRTDIVGFVPAELGEQVRRESRRKPDRVGRRTRPR